MSHIFISYVREDQLLVDKLAADLTAKGALIWLDRESINPGQRWQDAISEAIEHGNFFIACFSSNSVRKQRSVMNEELLIAVDELRKRSYGSIWFIPVLFDHCTAPPIPIGAGQTLQNLQWVSLTDNWNDGIERIAVITLDLEKKAFRRETDAKADLVIEAERELLRQEHWEAENSLIRKDYNWEVSFNALNVYKEKIRSARANYDQFRDAYRRRFNEGYDPIFGRYQEFDAERSQAKTKVEERRKEFFAGQQRFQLLGIGCLGVVFVVVLVVYYFFGK